MKRILSLLLCVLFVLSAFPAAASAAGTPTVRVERIEAASGETVTLHVAVENNPGIYALTFSFRYDTSRLKLTNVAPNTQSFPGTWETGSLKGAAWVSNAGDIVANDTILTMSFEVLKNAADGDAQVEVVLGEILNEDMDDITFSSAPGAVTVQTQRLPGDVNGDGRINIVDLVRLRKFLAGDDVTIEQANSDVTGEGDVDTADLMRLRKYLVGTADGALNG